MPSNYAKAIVNETLAPGQLKARWLATAAAFPDSPLSEEMFDLFPEEWRIRDAGDYYFDNADDNNWQELFRLLNVDKRTDYNVDLSFDDGTSDLIADLVHWLLEDDDKNEYATITGTFYASRMVPGSLGGFACFVPKDGEYVWTSTHDWLQKQVAFHKEFQATLKDSPISTPELFHDVLPLRGKLVTVKPEFADHLPDTLENIPRVVTGGHWTATDGVRYMLHGLGQVCLWRPEMLEIYEPPNRKADSGM